MNDADEHDGEREVKDKDRLKSTSFPEDSRESTAKLVPIEGSGLSGPFIRRPVMTVLLTLSVIVAGLATYGKLAVNDLPAVDYPVIQVTCSYPGADPYDDGQQHRHAAGKTISANPRARHHHQQ